MSKQRSIKWQKFWRRDYTYQYVENCLRAFTGYLEEEKLTSFKHLIFVREGGGSSVYVAKAEAERFYGELHKKFTDSNDEILRYKKRILRAGRAYLGSARVVGQFNINRISNDKLSSFLNNYYDNWLGFTMRVWVVWHGSEHFSNLELRLVEEKACQLGLRNRLPRYIRYISTPTKKSSILLLNEQLDKFKKGESIDLERLYKKFLWMPCGDLHGRPWTKEEFLAYAYNYLPSKDDGVKPLNPGRDLRLNTAEKLIVKISKEMAYLRDYRDEMRRRSVYEARNLYAEVARRFGVSYDSLMYYSTPETLELFKGKKLSDKELERRHGDAVILLKNGKMEVLTGQGKAKILKTLVLDNQIPNDVPVSEIRGMAACKGVARGVAKIVKLNSDLGKVENDDVMVAVTTHPDYVPRMQLASAIVTDEGGLTCHAAIVARELGIPCVIGTKNATKIFKDGDMVEVDAKNGIVRKI